MFFIAMVVVVRAAVDTRNFTATMLSLSLPAVSMYRATAGRYVKVATIACMVVSARSVRRLGEISAKLEKGKPGPQREIGSSARTYLSKIAVLAEAGNPVSKSQAHQAEKIAAIPKARFERMVETSVLRELTIAALTKPRGVRDAQQPDSVDDWFTPLVIIEAARVVLGGIDLDPASTPQGIKYAKFATISATGLPRPHLKNERRYLRFSINRRSSSPSRYESDRPT